MPTIKIKTLIQADIDTCFDLARDIDFHKKSMQNTNERAIAGKTSGLIELGESVTWKATHFGIRQKLNSKITAFQAPDYFVDEQVSGAFKSFKHKHVFNKIGEKQTEMIDVFQFESPFGILGELANILFLKSYMTKLLHNRAELLKVKAEK